MRQKHGININILDDVKLSWQELLEYAHNLSLAHKIYTKKVEYRHFSLSDEYRWIENAYFLSKKSKNTGIQLPTISKWIYDNRYLFVEQIKQTGLHKKAQRLPHIKNGRFAHYPRIFVLAFELARHSSFYITENGIQEFLAAYQEETGLDSGELWLFVDMLKIALLRAVAELSKRSVRNLKMLDRAAEFCSEIEKDMLLTKNVIKEYKSFLRNPEFIEQAMARLRESPNLAAVKEAINKSLSAYDLSVQKLINKAHASQAKSIMLISNAITSLRTLSKINFETIFENVSVVHKNLSRDEDYLGMDFKSREYYRDGIAKIAMSIKASEPAVAKAAYSLAQKSNEHVGQYIVGVKRHFLFKEFGKMPQKEKLRNLAKRHMLLLYVGTTIISTIISAALLCVSLFFMYPAIYGIMGFLISLIPIYTVAVAVNNRFFSILNKPKLILKMKLENGIPEHCAVMVVIPALVTSLESGREILEKMRVYYAANQQKNIYFCLLSDFKENKNEVTADDEQIIERLEQDIKSINKNYERNIFFYAQRKRTLVPGSNKYSGRERKRGALLDFCNLLCGDLSEFSHVTKGLPDNIKYIITLDADTELARDAAVKLVGAMEHPLNRAEIDEAANTVKRGYAIMQPRIGVDVVSAVKTKFSHVFSGNAGIDTYAAAASDIYQDGFGSGIFTGKGIFNLEIYKKVLENAFPDNRILSHDLLEGSYLRCALVSDVILMDGYPAEYISWAERQHRWARGDWQLMPWLCKNVSTKNGKIKNPLSKLAKYQILDNLRRSLVMPFCFIVILLSQTAFYRSAFFWLISGILPLFIDGILDFAGRIITIIRNAGKGSTLKDAWLETKTLFERAFYQFAFLPYQTYRMADAAIRTIIRVAVTKRNMLEWVTAAEGEKKSKHTAVYYWKKMFVAPLLAAALYCLSILATGTFSLVAFLVFAVWFFAPSIAYAISKQIKERKYVLDKKQQEFLEDIALKTWRFFEKFSKESDYLWMPDNYQQSPRKGIAARTSPTNIAFSMVSGIIAYYLGFCTLIKAINTLDACVAGIEKAKKWEGHLYNWYDIVSLEPLEPRYVSSVDNGNMACYLIVAAEALDDMIASPIAAYMQRGLSAVCRECKKEISFYLNDDIFSAINALGKIEDRKDELGEIKNKFDEFIGKYAQWAYVMRDFPTQFVHTYIEQTKELREKLKNISIGDFVLKFHSLLELLSAVMEKATEESHDEILQWAKLMETTFGECYICSRRLCQKAIRLRARITQVFDDMDFSRLYDENKGLFSIGLNVKTNKLSDSHYDLLASEARQTGFIAIAKGDVPEKHWFRLSRPLAAASKSRVLLSWGGSMFEYLMPLLIMKNYDNTMLSETYKSVVEMQRDYGEQRHIPWGVSESGYYAFDLNMNYQYKSFGIPSLGMKSGLVRETVISPYSVCLALHINPKAALSNMAKLCKLGARGRYGFYEAIDYTRSRMHRGKEKRIVKSYMVHHQGMILASLLNCLQEAKMQELFHSAMCVKATQTLLKEKVPSRNVTLRLNDVQPEKTSFADEIHAARVYTNTMQYPQAHFLSNGRYTVMLTQYGTGYSKCDNIMVNRWHQDCLRRAPGIHIYIKDLDSGVVWSAAFLPTCVRVDSHRVVFEQHKASYITEAAGLETTLEICVSPECNMEVRSLNIKNNRETAASLAVFCAYTPALCSEADFKAHPAFAELFIDTQADEENNVVYARRRGRNICSAMKVCTQGSTELMTDRTKIFGRQNEFGIPSCMADRQTERDVARAVGIKSCINLNKEESQNISFVIASAKNMQKAFSCLSGITGEDDIKRVFQLAWTHSQVEMRYLKLKDAQANIFQSIASRTVIKTPPAHAFGGQPEGIEKLWEMGISGDLPIICILASDICHIGNVELAAKAQEFMSLKHVKADMVIVYEGGEEYFCPIRDKVTELQAAAMSRPYNKIIALSASSLSKNDMATILHASCLVLKDSESLGAQLKTDTLLRTFMVFGKKSIKENPKIPKRIKAYDNSAGGFINHGNEYAIDVADKAPLPWSNLLVNKSFGSLISAGGGGYTWAENARMMRLTPFRNDALTDVSAESVLIRNDATGKVFSAAPDMYVSGKYRVIHGFGYSEFNRYGNIDCNAEYFTDFELPVKAGIISLVNNTKQKQELSLYYFAEPVLGAAVRDGILAKFENEILTASSSFSDADKCMFISMPGQNVRYTASAYEFFGTPGNNIIPAALKTHELSNSAGFGASLLALQTRICLLPAEKKQIPVILGYGNNNKIADAVKTMGSIKSIKERQKKTKDSWKVLVGSIKISTSNKSFDILVNGWLTYQTYAARLWGRTGYYQSGGAFGFRDQLQDVLSLIYTNPLIAREQIIKCAAHQFLEGDVLHWWHEPAQGVRTKISDDKLFLPYVACEYERITGEMSVFDEQVKYLKSLDIPQGKNDIYEEFMTGERSESVFSHCRRAIDSALVLGENGLPLIGTGDWNDGMDKIGEQGKGESVWLAFFLAEVLRMFCPLCRARNENELAEEYEKQRRQIMGNIEQNAWDGQWYMRAFFDDGTAIGTNASPECKIDLVSQAWAVISGAQRAKRAFSSAEEHLVMREEGVIRLLSPPFDKWDKNPGYIKDYLPGIRENGGQYTHAAAWFVIAAAKLGLKDQALFLFQMLNPINHTRTPEGVEKYKGEPYVMAADVYYSDEHKGRAGWTWYTGAAGWMYQAAIIYILGMRIDRGELMVAPCVPDDFGEYTIDYKKDGALYKIRVKVAAGYSGCAWLCLNNGERTKSIKLDKHSGVHEIFACW